MKHAILSELDLFDHTGNIEKDMQKFLTLHGYEETAIHCFHVGRVASDIARQFNENEESARIGGLLHDISAVFPNERRIEVAETLGLPVLPEERTFPLIIHQKISAIMAEEIFGVQDQPILSAIGCHTTLKKNASRLDKVLFVADKIGWDGEGSPPYLEQMLQELEKSLDAGVFCYLDYMIKRKESLPVVHPWFREAHAELRLSQNLQNNS